MDKHEKMAKVDELFENYNGPYKMESLTTKK